MKSILFYTAIVFTLLIYHASIQAQESPSALKAGYAQADITPPMGTEMPGYFSGRKATGVKDPLLAKALVLSQGETTMAIVALDLIGVRKSVVDEIRQAVQAKTNIPPERVFVHATHTHTGGDVGEIKDRIIEPIATAVEQALKNAAPEEAPTYGVEQTDSVAFIRRYLMKDGTVKTNPGRDNPEIVRPIDAIDPNLRVLTLSTAKTMLVSYGLHPDCIGGTEFSGDYMYHITQTVKKELGDEWNVVYLNSCCGNINHINVNDPTQKSSYEESNKIGRTLAQAALKAHREAKPFPVTSIDVAHRVVNTRRRSVPAERLEWAKAELAKDPDVESKRKFNESTPKGILRIVNDMPESEPTEILVFRIGELAIVGLPAEVFVEISRDIQTHSLLDATWAIGLTGGAMGYQPHPRGYDEGGYEATYNSARYDRETGTLWADTALELVKGMSESKQDE